MTCRWPALIAGLAGAMICTFAAAQVEETAQEGQQEAAPRTPLQIDPSLIERLRQRRGESLPAASPQDVREGIRELAGDPLRDYPPPIGQDRLTIYNANDARRTGDVVELVGNVHVNYAGWEIYAERVTGDLRQEIFHLDRGARLYGREVTILGDTITLDARTGEFRFTNATIVLGPEALDNQTAGPIFAFAKEGFGTEREFHLYGVSATTCDDPDHLHYVFGARSVTIRPGREAIFRHLDLHVLDNRVISIPVLVVPLVENAERYVPAIGQSPDEGYYIKTRIGIPIRGDDFVDARVDYMTRLGPGLGGDFRYQNESLSGSLQAYSLVARDSLNIISQHSQEVFGGNLYVDAQYQRNNVFTAPNSTTFNTRAQYVRQDAASQSRVSFYRSSSSSFGFDSTTQGLNFNDDRRWSGTFRTRFDTNYNESVSGGIGQSVSRRAIDVDFSGTQEMRTMTAELQYRRTIPVGESEGFFGAADVTPMLTLRSDARRLLGQQFGSSYPFRFEASVGQLADPGAPEGVTRFGFSTDIRRNERLGPLQLQYGGRFRQTVYSDDTAQYILDYDARATYNFARNSSLNLSYRFLRPFGFSPLSFDRTGRWDAISMDMTYRPSEAWRLSAQTGYDVLQSSRGRAPWQLLWLRADYEPSRDFAIRTSAVYDTQSLNWGNLRGELFHRRGEQEFALGVRYDGRREQLASATARITGFRIGRLTGGALVAYNGYTSQIEAQQYTLVWDMHCTEFVFELTNQRAGFRSGTQIAFFVRIKALPFVSPFGIGTRGQSIGGVGGVGF